ncbi:MAG TPA: hypothetical protein VK815_11425 [Candidatus Acidoferrales bacterium]|nr:hypothetical protein [Candidatus Acidoferrales bacterium]
MPIREVEIQVAGKPTKVPAADVCGQTVIAKGGRIKMASVLEDAVTPGEHVGDPAKFVEELKRSGLKADVLSFFQRPPDVVPKFPYHHDMDNYAAIDTTNYEAWWNSLSQETRRNSRLAAKRGVEVKIVMFDDELARGIHKLCNESPVRQGKPFWHYGKDFEVIKRDHATLLDRSFFVAAYLQGELIGFIKFVQVDQIGFLLHNLAFASHNDKRPSNAMVAKAVELCSQKGLKYFVHDKFTYGNKTDSTLREFKRRNGYTQVDFPRYYIPLTLKGRIYVGLRLYRGVIGLLPRPVLSCLLTVRGWFNRSKAKPPAPKKAEAEAKKD